MRDSNDAMIRTPTSDHDHSEEIPWPNPNEEVVLMPTSSDSKPKKDTNTQSSSSNIKIGHDFIPEELKHHEQNAMKKRDLVNKDTAAASPNRKEAHNIPSSGVPSDTPLTTPWRTSRTFKEQKGSPNVESSDMTVNSIEPGSFLVRGPVYSTSNCSVVTPTSQSSLCSSTAQQEEQEEQDDDETPILVATLVPDDPSANHDVAPAEAVKDSFFQLLRHDLRTQLGSACIVLVVIGLAIGLVLGLSSNETTLLPRPRLPAAVTIDGTVENGEFGSTVSFSTSATRVAIGSSGENGVAQIYQERGDASWDLIGTITNGMAGISGMVVALAGNGNRVAVTVPMYPRENGTSVGRTVALDYIQDGQWDPLGLAIPGEEEAIESRVSLSEDGNVVAIGEVVDDVTSHSRVFEFVNGVWTQLGSRFLGSSVALSANGSRVAIGSESTVEPDAKATLRMFEYDGSGDEWTQLGSDIKGGDGMFDMGFLTAMSDDGNVVAIGSYYTDPSQVRGIDFERMEQDEVMIPSLLSVKVYRYTGGKWAQMGETLHRYFKNNKIVYSVSLSSNGEVVGIGDPGKVVQGQGASGHCHVMRWNGDEWVHIHADVDGEAAGDWFGASMSLSGDGSRAAIGAPRNRHNGYDHGRVQVFELAGV